MPRPGPGKALCGAQRPNQPKGVTCQNVAGHGTDHVGTGRCARHGGLTPSHKRAAEVELAKQAAAKYGLPVDVDPAEAMMRAVAVSYGSVLYMEAAVAALDKPWTEGEDGGKPHVAWTMLMAERKQHTDICRDALRAGVERRNIELQEGMARKLVEGFAAFARLLGHDPAAPTVREAGRAAFQLIAGGKGDVVDGEAREVG